VATNPNTFASGIAFGDSPVPAVDPVDLGNVWRMQRECQAAAGEETIQISFDLYERTCSPGANVGAVFHRVSQLQMLAMLGTLDPWMHDGIPDDVVFQVFATLPVKGMQVGVPYKGPQFEVEEFLLLINKKIQE
jgi:hypothetical protein